MSDQATVLFDAPGPKTRRRNLIVGIIASVVILLLLAGVIWGLRDQYAPAKFTIFGNPSTWVSGILPGLMNTIQAAVISVVCAGLLGTLLGLGRMSEFAPLRWLCAVVVEFFRSVPVLLMMFFAYNLFVYVLSGVLQGSMNSLAAVVIGLTLYNASVIAELLRSGMHSLPKGQREAGLAIGLSGSQTRTIVLLPQAITAMLPSLVSQLVVVLKDSALGSIVLYPELLRSFTTIANNNGNTIASLTICAAIFIIINYTLTALASLVQRRMSKRGGGSINKIAQGAGVPTAS